MAFTKAEMDAARDAILSASRYIDESAAEIERLRGAVEMLRDYRQARAAVASAVNSKDRSRARRKVGTAIGRLMVWLAEIDGEGSDG